MTDEFRALLQQFIRGFGLLEGDRTPCGKPLPTSDAHALMVLLGAGEAGMPQTALAARLGIDKSTTSRLVARLTESGRVAPAPAASDGRAKPICLTTKGARLAREIDEASRKRFAALLAGMPEGRRAGVVRALRDVVAALERLDPDERERNT